MTSTRPAPDQVKCTCCGRHFPTGQNRARCERCRQARQPSDRQRRYDIAGNLFPTHARSLLLARVAAGENLADVCRDLGITQARVRGWAAFDPDWEQRLDVALTAGRDPDLDHGTINAYRWGRCRCPECRQARAALG